MLVADSCHCQWCRPWPRGRAAQQGNSRAIYRCEPSGRQWVGAADGDIFLFPPSHHQLAVALLEWGMSAQAPSVLTIHLLHHYASWMMVFTAMRWQMLAVRCVDGGQSTALPALVMLGMLCPYLVPRSEIPGRGTSSYLFFIFTTLRLPPFHPSPRACDGKWR